MFEDQESIFGQAGVLSVSVVLSVECAMECRMRVNGLFCAVSLSGTMWSALPVLHGKTV